MAKSTTMKRARSKQELDAALDVAERLLVATSAFAMLVWRDAKPDFETTQPPYYEDDPTLTVRVFGADKAHGGVALLLGNEGQLLAGPSLLDDMLIGWKTSGHPHTRSLAGKCEDARHAYWAKDSAP